MDPFSVFVLVTLIVFFILILLLAVDRALSAPEKSAEPVRFGRAVFRLERPARAGLAVSTNVFSDKLEVGWAQPEEQDFFFKDLRPDHVQVVREENGLVVYVLDSMVLYACWISDDPYAPEQRALRLKRGVLWFTVEKDVLYTRGERCEKHRVGPFGRSMLSDCKVLKKDRVARMFVSEGEVLLVNDEDEGVLFSENGSRRVAFGEVHDFKKGTVVYEIDGETRLSHEGSLVNCPHGSRLFVQNDTVYVRSAHRVFTVDMALSGVIEYAVQIDQNALVVENGKLFLYVDGVPADSIAFPDSTLFADGDRFMAVSVSAVENGLRVRLQSVYVRRNRLLLQKSEKGSVPIGVIESVKGKEATVALRGTVVELSDLRPGRRYYADPDGVLTTDGGKREVGFALTETALALSVP